MIRFFEKEDETFRAFLLENTDFVVIARNEDGSAVVASGSDIPIFEQSENSPNE